MERIGRHAAAILRQGRVRRLAVLSLITLAGLGATVGIWWKAMSDSNQRASATLSAVAREVHAVLNIRVERHMEALRNLALFWQLHGLLDQEAWNFNTKMLIGTFRGMDWIAWVNGQGHSFRFAAADSTFQPDSEVIEKARARASLPGSEISYPERAGDPFLVFMPVRTPDDSVGVLVASVAPSRLLGREHLTIGEIIAYVVHSDTGEEVYRSGPSAAVVPAGMPVEMNLSQAFGKMWTVRYEPTQEYLHGVVSKWHNYFLLTGALLSLAMGAIGFQFLRLREFSGALTATNRRLDAQVRELSERDLKLSKLNDDLEERVQARTAQLLEVVTELEAFSHSISHDLRSPVGAVLNFTSILEEDYGTRLDDEGKRVLRRIRESGQSAIDLLDQLVQFLWAGREQGEASEVDMTAVARDAYDEVVSGHVDARNVHFQLHDLPPVRGNAALMGRVFRNLLSNAVKYTRGRDERRIEVGGEEREGENVYTVSDNGVGFEPTQSEAVFEPFRRLHSSKEYDGAGLGLAIVAKIVRRHGGRVWAESDGSGGACFGFALPRQGGAA